MADSKTQLALREWRTEMSSSVTWAALLGVAAVLALVGPFETDKHLSLVQRSVYWLVLAVLTYGAGGLVNGLIRRWMSGQGMVLAIFCAGAATGAVVSVIVLVANWVVFDFIPDGSEWFGFFGTVFAISFIVTCVLHYIAMRLSSDDPPQEPSGTWVALLDRLPLEKRGPLLALSVEDHYVRVRTQNGEEMILMRLTDAIREVGGTKGAQVHRSHWVAFAAVIKAERKGDRAILTLRDGSEIPVSRANLPKIKEAGLLPR